MSAGGRGALAGLRVVDLTQMLAGPFCTMLLADQGAEVIKVEPPGGDMTRRAAPYFADDEARHFGGYYQSINRNKKSISIDLKTADGKAIVRRLVKEADVLVENFRAGTMERLGLSYESLAELNPRLVYATVRGFGDPRTGASPYADWPAFDVVAQAMGGIMGITGPDREHPLKVGPGVGDIVPAMLLAVGVLAAVRHAERTGEGQFVDVRHVRRRPGPLRADSPPAFLCRRGAGTRRQRPSPALPVRDVCGQRRLGLDRLSARSLLAHPDRGSWAGRNWAPTRGSGRTPTVRPTAAK